MNKLKKLCSGCYYDYYNQPGNSTTGECWLLESAEKVTRSQVGTWDNPPYTWIPKETLSCHRPQGRHWLEKTDCRFKHNWKNK